MACKHTNIIKIGKLKCCLRCGMCRDANGQHFFDRTIINYNSKKERRKHVKKS